MANAVYALVAIDWVHFGTRSPCDALDNKSYLTACWFYVPDNAQTIGMSPSDSVKVCGRAPNPQTYSSCAQGVGTLSSPEGVSQCAKFTTDSAQVDCVIGWVTRLVGLTSRMTYSEAAQQCGGLGDAATNCARIVGSFAKFAPEKGDESLCGRLFERSDLRAACSKGQDKQLAERELGQLVSS